MLERKFALTDAQKKALAEYSKKRQEEKMKPAKKESHGGN